ncbi:hypothetical protein H4S07_005291 [Coemansia furcata]|uniref:Uncharacterized protein n=1 Tax=Coemansia furcata TaxID=417177 RepID=A0ACC1L333_9FUNG|nr:hypothetical protein H4S07_005291 [Coemansia furcata]
MCDPIDLPAVPTPVFYVDIQSRGGRRQGIDIPWGLGHSSCQMSSDEEDLYLAEMHIIPTQLLTPPPSPIGSLSEGIELLVSRAQQRSAVELVPKVSPSFSGLLHLPPHMLLSIVSCLSASDMIHLSQTCTRMANYLSTNSAVWTQLCRTYLAYTPERVLKNNQQAAEYYLGIRGNHRLESLVLKQRKRVEVTIDYIIRSK